MKTYTDTHIQHPSLTQISIHLLKHDTNSVLLFYCFTCSQLLCDHYALKHTHTCTHSHICIPTCIYFLSHACAHIHAHTHTHTHTHTLPPQVRENRNPHHTKKTGMQSKYMKSVNYKKKSRGGGGGGGWGCGRTTQKRMEKNTNNEKLATTLKHIHQLPLTSNSSKASSCACKTGNVLSNCRDREKIINALIYIPYCLMISYMSQSYIKSVCMCV